jgi:hypothetical protein
MAATASIPQLSLDTLDSLPPGDLALFCAAEERPLLAAAGYVDWRLNGWLSRLIVRNQFKGGKKECLLTPSMGRIPPTRIFMFGLGPAQQFQHKMAAELGEAIAEGVAHTETLALTVGLPGIGDADAHQALLAALCKHLPAVKMTTWGPWSKL